MQAARSARRNRPNRSAAARTSSRLYPPNGGRWPASQPLTDRPAKYLRRSRCVGEGLELVESTSGPPPTQSIFLGSSDRRSADWTRAAIHQVGQAPGHAEKIGGAGAKSAGGSRSGQRGTGRHESGRYEQGVDSPHRMRKPIAPPRGGPPLARGPALSL